VRPLSSFSQAFRGPRPTLATSAPATETSGNGGLRHRGGCHKALVPLYQPNSINRYLTERLAR